MKVARSFETSGRNYPITWRNNPEDLASPYENKFGTNNTL